MSTNDYSTGIQITTQLQSMNTKALTDEDVLKWFRSLPSEIKDAFIKFLLFIEGKETDQPR